MRKFMSGNQKNSSQLCLADTEIPINQKPVCTRPKDRLRPVPRSNKKHEPSQPLFDLNLRNEHPQKELETRIEQLKRVLEQKEQKQD